MYKSLIFFVSSLVYILQSFRRLCFGSAKLLIIIIIIITIIYYYCFVVIVIITTDNKYSYPSA
jgi:hypothetical protein